MYLLRWRLSSQHRRLVKKVDERAKSGKAPIDVVEMLKWAHGTYELPENQHLGYGQSGVPEFLMVLMKEN